jgi:hypothetical protein
VLAWVLKSVQLSNNLPAVPVLAEVHRQIGLVITGEKLVVEKRKRAHNLCEEVQPRIETLAAAGS